MARILPYVATFALLTIAAFARDALPRAEASGLEAPAVRSCQKAGPTTTAGEPIPSFGRSCAGPSWGGGGTAAGGGDGSISGTVTEDGSSIPIANACVFVIEQSSFLLSSIARADALGAYTAGGLGAGTYKVGFSDCAPPGFHLPEYYNDQQNVRDANVVTVASGEHVEGIDASLAPGGGAVSGTATEEGTGMPIAGICVFVYDEGDIFTAAITGASGAYTAGGLPSGDYHVQFDSCTSPEYYNAEWYNNAPDEASSDLVHVGSAGTTRSGVNASLTVGGSITGRVTEAGTGNALPNICVYSYEASGGLGGDADITDVSGDYELGGVPPGTYKLFFRDCADSQTHAGQWYDHQTGLDTGTEVNVSRHRTTSGVNGVMKLGGLISGRVTAEGSNSPLSGICVTAYNSSSFLAGFGPTDGDGHYQLAVAPGGSYAIFYFDCTEAFSYNSEYYNNQRTYPEANNVQVRNVGDKTGGIDAMLLPRMAGDANCNRSVNSIDVAVILQYVAALIFELPCDVNADVNRDGAWTPVDAALVLQYEAGLLHQLPS